MARSSRHWYKLNEDGSIVDSHNSGIKEARANKLFISPTSVLSDVRATPFHLVRWQRQQLVNACNDAPRMAGESEGDYYERVNELSFRRSDTATNFGTRIHAIAEHYPLKQADPALEPWYDQFKIWHADHVAEDLGQEERVADSDIGVAGTLDRRVVLKDGRLAVLDIKTQGIKDKVYYGDSWPPQLSCYSNAVRKKYSLPFNPVCINVIIDSTAPNPLITKEWSAEEINEAYRDFVCAVWLFSRSNKHWPCGVWDLANVLSNNFLCPK